MKKDRTLKTDLINILNSNTDKRYAELSQLNEKQLKELFINHIIDMNQKHNWTLVDIHVRYGICI